MQSPGEQGASRTHRFAEFFALKRNIVILLIAIFVIGAGEELWMRFVPKYLKELGAAVLIIALPSLEGGDSFQAGVCRLRCASR